MKYRTIKEAAGKSERITSEQAREAVSAVARAREIKRRLREQGRTFSDSTEIIREDRGTLS
jgi:cytidylate kinase